MERMPNSTGTEKNPQCPFPLKKRRRQQRREEYKQVVLTSVKSSKVVVGCCEVIIESKLEARKKENDETVCQTNKIFSALFNETGSPVTSTATSIL